ncbi:MAG: hypothetical protein ACE15F_09935 [bacterium]
MKKNTKPRRGPGRPVGAGIKLTAEAQDIIVTAIRCGNYLETAAACAGIHRDTLHSWIRKGATAPEGDCYRIFSDLVYKALAQSEGEAVEFIRQAGEEHGVTRTRTTVKPLLDNGRPVLDVDGKPVLITEETTEQFTETDWRALAWLLERRFSKRWGRREYLESTITEKPVEEMTDAEIDAELAEILER